MGNIFLDEDGNPVARMQVTGSNMEIYIANGDSMPDVADVPKGAVVVNVDTDEVWQSNGTSWVVK